MAKIWFYRRGDRQFGPFDASYLKQLAKDGTLRPSDLVTREGDGKWVAATSVKGLFSPSSPAVSNPPPLPSTTTDAPKPLGSRSGRQEGKQSISAALLPKPAALTKRTLRRWLLVLLGGAVLLAVLLPTALKQFAPLPFRKAPPLSESWKDYVNAMFFQHFINCSDLNGPLLSYRDANCLETPTRRIPLGHLLAISYRELENTSSIEFPIQGVLKGHYYIFPRSDEDRRDANLYQEYQVEFRCVPETLPNSQWGLGYEYTRWSLKTATAQKVMSGGRPVSGTPESLSVGYQARIRDRDRFPAMHVFREGSLGGYWPIDQTLALACKEVMALRWEMEKTINFPKIFDSPSSDEYDSLREALEKLLKSAIEEQVELAKPLLADLPTPRPWPDRQHRRRLAEASEKFEQLQSIAARLCAIVNIGNTWGVAGYGRDADELPVRDVVCEVLARVTPGSEAHQPDKLEQKEYYRVASSTWFKCLPSWLWSYPPPLPPSQADQAGRADSSRQNQQPAGTYDAKYEVFSPGPISVKYRNGLGGWDEKRMAAKQDGSYVIEVTLSADQTAQITAKALDRDAPISAWIYVNGTRVAVSSDNDGGGTVTASGNLQSPEK
jgi:hypothetical protein